MRALGELERQETRVLGALRLVDAGTGATLERNFRVTSADPSVRLLPNRSGLYVVTAWAPLSAHEVSFRAPPAAPDIGSLNLTLRIDDPLGLYLPRLLSLPLPRDPDPEHGDRSDSLFRPQRVPLYPSASAPTGANWALLRVSISARGNGDALGGALLRVRRNGEVLARGLSDWRGEALVPVVGVPVTTFSDDEDAVVVSEIEVILEAVFDPDHALRTPAAEVSAGRPPAQLPLVDPDALEAAAGGLPSDAVVLPIAARRAEHRRLRIPLP
jgi:hypothetical protein